MQNIVRENALEFPVVKNFQLVKYAGNLLQNTADVFVRVSVKSNGMLGTMFFLILAKIPKGHILSTLFSGKNVLLKSGRATKFVNIAEKLQDKMGAPLTFIILFRIASQKIILLAILWHFVGHATRLLMLTSSDYGQLLPIIAVRQSP